MTVRVSARFCVDYARQRVAQFERNRRRPPFRSSFDHSMSLPKKRLSLSTKDRSKRCEIVTISRSSEELSSLARSRSLIDDSEQLSRHS